MITALKRGRPQKTSMPLSDCDEGALIKIAENGTPVEFYVAKHDYESGLNGAGRTLVVRKVCWKDIIQWSAANLNRYVSSTIDTFFNQTYAAILDSSILQKIGNTKIYYTPGGGQFGVSVTERPVFALSITELGVSTAGSSINVEGSTLPTASLLRIAKTDTGSVQAQWTRSPSTGNLEYVAMVGTTGELIGQRANSVGFSRPCFTLPASTKINPDTMEVTA